MIQSFSIFNGNNFPESYLSKVFTLSSNLSYVAAPGTARHCYVETVTLRLARSQQNIVTERRCDVSLFWVFCVLRRHISCTPPPRGYGGYVSPHWQHCLLVPSVRTSLCPAPDKLPWTGCLVRWRGAGASTHQQVIEIITVFLVYGTVNKWRWLKTPPTSSQKSMQRAHIKLNELYFYYISSHF